MGQNHFIGPSRLGLSYRTLRHTSRTIIPDATAHHRTIIPDATAHRYAPLYAFRKTISPNLVIVIGIFVEILQYHSTILLHTNMYSLPVAGREDPYNTTHKQKPHYCG